jgi:hypothetical protein
MRAPGFIVSDHRHPFAGGRQERNLRKRAKRGTAEPVLEVDDGTVQRLADAVLRVPDLSKIPDAALADALPEVGYNLALLAGRKGGMTTAESVDFATRVRRRIEWKLFENRQK